MYWNARIWGRLFVSLCLAAGFGTVTSVLGQTTESTPEEQYHRHVHINEDMTPLGEDPFGEQVNLYTGELSFEQADIVLHGNGPDIVIARSFSPGWRAGNTTAVPTDGEFADWQLALPELTSMVQKTLPWQQAYAGYGGAWTVGMPTYDSTNRPVFNNNRCSQMSLGPHLVDENSGALMPVNSSIWWHGYQLIIPGQTPKNILIRTNSQLAPTMSDPSGRTTFDAFTPDQWMIGCLPTTASGEPGEAFWVVAPDGTKYWLNWFRYQWGPREVYQLPGLIKPTFLLASTMYAKAMVTQIQDRFGNWVRYHYNGAQLASITASDGREVNVFWRTDGSGWIDHISVTTSSGATRTWSYQYGNITADTFQPGYFGNLSAVVLPDNSSWQFNLRAFTGVTVGPDSVDGTQPYCIGGYTYVQNEGVSTTGSITHPSGLTGTFTLKALQHIRVGENQPSSSACGSTAEVPYFQPGMYWVESLVGRTYTGAGVNESWSYSYINPPHYWASQCPNGVCPANGIYPSNTKSTLVTDPSGNVTRYDFNNVFNSQLEGKLVNTYYGFNASANTYLRWAQNSYDVVPSGAPFNNPIGNSLDALANPNQNSNLTPLQQQTTVEEGDTYVWQALAINPYGQATDTKRYNSIAGQTPIEETTAYLNDTSTWVLGLPQTVTNAGTGEVEASNVYGSLDTLQSRSRFGEPLMSYTYDSAGQLASFTDGNNHTTRMSNYVMGIPASVSFPDGTSESMMVDGFGEITAITDQVGNTTQYSYDPIGRISLITYPTNDAVSWYPKQFTYSFVPSAERGVPVGHWDRVTTTGNAQTVTYFDAELRPVLTDTTNGSGHYTTASAYDFTGKATFASYPASGSPSLGSITVGSHHTYDALGRLTQTQEDSELGALTTTTAYLGSDGERVTDPKGNATTTYFQAFDKPDYTAPILVNAPAGISQRIARDRYGNPTSITQSGSYGSENDSVTKTLVYDSYHRLCRTTEPESGSTVMAYDAANNLQWSAQGQTIADGTCGQSDVPVSAQTTRTYDAMNRVLAIMPPAGTQSTAYTYDARGNIATAASGLATQAFNYNTRNLLTSQVLSVAGSGYAWGIAYNYDSYGHVDAIGYPTYNGTSEGVAYAPDALGRATQVGGYASGIIYFPNGQVAGFNYGNGASYLAQQNTRQLLNNFSYGIGSVLNVSEDLAYDGDGNITNVNDLVSGKRTKSFGYDALNRLTGAVANGLYGTESYTYDALNNLRTRLTGGNTLAFNYNTNNQLASVSQGASTITIYGYDAQGNRNSLSSGGASTAYTFDAENQLLQISGVEGYAYDAAGRRIAKLDRSGTPTTYYFYDQAGQLMYTFAPATALGTNYIYLGNKLIARHAMQELAVPGTLSVNTNPNNGNFSLSWNAVPQATSYALQENSNGGGSWSTIYSGSATTASVAGRAGGSYSYRAQACASAGCSNWIISPIVGIWPATPSITVPSGTINGTYTVSWNASPSATGYTVQEAVNGGAWNTIAANTAATSLNRPGTSSGNYTYQVEANNSYGTAGWSATSNTVVVNTAYGVVPTPAPTFTVPAANYTGTQTISWTASSPITSYTLQQSSNGGTNWATVYSGTATSTTLTGLSAGSYVYQLQACNTAGGGMACTAWASAGPMVVTIPPNNAPGLSTPGLSNNGGYTVSWTGVNAATDYTLQQQVNGGGWGTILSGGATSWNASGEGDGTYAYRVQGCNAGGCGPWSNTGTTVVDYPPGTAPSLGGGGTSHTGNYTISWAPVANATSYTLQESANGGAWTTVQAGSATSWSTSGRGNGTYNYQAQACDSGGCGPWSNTSVTVALPPAAPTGAHLTSSSNGKVINFTAYWNAVSGATYYQGENASTGVIQYSGAATYFFAYGWMMRQVPHEYPVAIRACNASGCSVWVMMPPP